MHFDTNKITVAFWTTSKFIQNESQFFKNAVKHQSGDAR
jgi:hypothetical protein